jgi:hypothetical protein
MKESMFEKIDTIGFDGIIGMGRKLDVLINEVEELKSAISELSDLIPEEDSTIDKLEPRIRIKSMDILYHF